MSTSAPPLEIDYQSLEEVRDAVNTHTLAEGHALIVMYNRTVGNKKNGSIKAVILHCSKGRRTKKESKNLLKNADGWALALLLDVHSKQVYVNKGIVGKYK